jgi:peptidoglycan/LPS O-acetylase OafA/YrhL
MRKHEYRLGYRADLEGLRAVAVLLVVAAHAGVPGVQGGFVGVDVFFVLSGFLITGLLVKELTSTGKLRFLDFYVRRLRRLLPALLVMLLVCGGAAAVLLAPSEQPAQAGTAAMAALWLSNLHFALAKVDYFAPTSDTNLYLHTWSLGVEEQFYLLWPALVAWLLAGGAAAGVRRLRIGLSLVLLVSLFSCVILTYRAPPLAFYMMPMRAWQFAAGALAWIHFGPPSGAEGKERRSSSMTVFGWSGLLVIVLASCLLGHGVPYPGVYSWLPTGGALLVIMAGSASGAIGGVSRLLSLRPLQFVGRISYSWYLWHWPVLLLGHALSGNNGLAMRLGWVAISFALAVLSYVFIETPIRESRHWLSRPRLALFAGLAVMVVANSLALCWQTHETVRMKLPPFEQYRNAHWGAPQIYGMGCDDWYHSDRVKVCAFGDPHAEHTVVLMGDSHAGQWFSAVAGSFLSKQRWRLLVLTKSSCPMVDEPVFSARIGREYTECEHWRSHALAEVALLKPDIVFLATTIDNPFGEKEWTEGTRKILDALSPAAGQIVLLRDTPQLPFDGPDCLARQAGRPAWLAPHDGCRSKPRKERQAMLVYTWLEEASRNFGNVHVLDLNSLICPSGTCAAEQRGTVVFRDSQHLTDQFAASLAPALRTRLNEMKVLPPTAP